MNSYNPLPEIKVVPLTASNQKPVSSQPRTGRPAKVPTALADIRSYRTDLTSLQE